MKYCVTLLNRHNDMKYIIDIRMVQVYHTTVEASSIDDLRKKIYKASDRWWEWTEENQVEKIKTLHVYNKDERVTVYKKEFPDGEEPVTTDDTWKKLVKEVGK